ncbi:MAG: insulinase family protein [Phycisphaerales bacterium]|nr:insulinase family protein [Phycisphaerales bacterium]
MPELHRFENGSTLCVERIDGVESVAMHLLIPGGSACDTDTTDGIAAMHGELLLRGDATHSTRELSDAMDAAGLNRSVTVGTQHLHLHGTTTGTHAMTGAQLLLDAAAGPPMDDAAVEASASLCLQSIASLEDDLEDLAVVTLQGRHRPSPLHRSGLGDAQVIPTLTPAVLRQAWAERAVPQGAFFSVAGNIDTDRVVNQVGARLSAWSGNALKPVAIERPAGGNVHLERSAAQVHLALAIDAVNATHESAEATRVAAMVLGGGSSSLLFLEVRQRRSLCYGISARWQGSRDDGFIQIVTGTTPQRAAETLETTCATIKTAAEAMSDDDIARATLQLRSAMVRSGESTRARSGALARDAYLFGEVRSLPERLAAVEAVRPEDVRAIASNWAGATPTIVAVGPEGIELPD